MDDQAVRLTTQLIRPYGGTLVDLLVTGEERDELMRRANHLPAVQLSARSLCDLELLAVGGFSPLDRFMGEADYLGTIEAMRLAGGTLFPVPVTLPAVLPEGAHVGTEIVLRSPNNQAMAIMLVEEVFPWDYPTEARQVCGTNDVRHPLVAEMASWPRWYISGPLKVLNLPRHYDFPEFRQTPAVVRGRLAELGYVNVVAFQTRNPIHRRITRR